METKYFLDSIEHAVSADGQAVRLKFERHDRSEFELDLGIPLGIGEVIQTLLKIAQAAGHDQPPIAAGQPAKMVRFQPSSAGLTLAHAGQTGLGFRFGGLDLVMELPTAQLQRIATGLLEQAHAAAMEPKRPQ